MARNQIKGITVEIGGDTTQLGKALEDVHKRTDSVSAELQEVNRLLRFDPDNAQLIAQRQLLLANQVENTAEKLETLREAERQVQAQFERGEASAEQVRALQREIIATEGRLNHYEEAVRDAADGTKKVGDEAKDTKEGFTIMKGAMSNLVSGGIQAMISGLGSLVSTMANLPQETLEYRTEMGKLSAAYETVGHRTEIAEEAYKRLQSVIGETDQSVEAAQQIALLAESEEDVVQWADLAAGVVARFGDALQPETFFEAANETMTLGEATGAYVQMLEGVDYDVEKFNAGLAACTTESEKQAYMLKITEELLGEAADTYRLTNEEVTKMNETNEAWNATMADLGATIQPLQTDVKMMGVALIQDLVPGVQGVIGAFRSLINGEEGSAEAVGTAISGLITQIVEMATNILPTLVETTLGLLTSLLTTVAPTIIDSLVQLIPQLVNTLIEGIPALMEGAVTLLLSIVDAIPTITVSLLSALPDLIMALIDGLLIAIPQLLDGAIQFLMAIVQAIPILLDRLLPEIPTIVDTIIDGLLDNIPVLIDGAVQLLFAILEAIPEIMAALYESAPSITKSLVEGLIATVPALMNAGLQLLEGLVKGMLDYDYMGAINSIGDGFIKGFKKVFDIHSPSRVMAGIGELLDEGLAMGIEEGANAPAEALDKLSTDMLEGTDALNGVTLERKVAHSFNAANTAGPAEGIHAKLDQIYRALLSGQVIMLDGKTLVGSTAVRYDTELGQRRVLAERGAI